MAHISINVSTEHGSDVSFSGPLEGINDAVFFVTEVYLCAGSVYARDDIAIHGSKSDLKAFADALTAAVNRLADTDRAPRLPQSDVVEELGI